MLELSKTTILFFDTPGLFQDQDRFYSQFESFAKRSGVKRQDVMSAWLECGKYIRTASVVSTASIVSTGSIISTYSLVSVASVVSMYVLVSRYSTVNTYKNSTIVWCSFIYGKTIIKSLGYTLTYAWWISSCNKVYLLTNQIPTQHIV